MTRGAFVLKPFAQAAHGDARRPSHASIAVVETGLNNRPYLAHEWCHILATTLNGYSQCEHCTSAIRALRGREVLLDLGTKSWKNLSWRKRGGKGVDDAQGRLGGYAFSSERHVWTGSLTRAGASSSISSGSSSVVMGIRPSKMGAARLLLCIFDFLLRARNQR